MRHSTGVTGLVLMLAFAQPALAADTDAGEKIFREMCSTCHGPAGGGNGPAAAGLTPKPRDLGNAEWQASVDNERLRTVITKGGTAVGLSPLMTPFGGALKGEDLDNVIAYIRSLAER